MNCDLVIRMKIVHDSSQASTVEGLEMKGNILCNQYNWKSKTH